MAVRVSSGGEGRRSRGKVKGKRSSSAGSPSRPVGEEGRVAPAPADAGVSFRSFAEGEGLHGVERYADIIEASVRAMAEYQVPAFLLRGPAGTGKTSLATLFARWWGAKLVYIQCTPGMSEDEFIYAIVPDESSRSGFRLSEGALVRALRESRRGRVVLVVDEVDKTRPRADAFFLDLVQNCRVTFTHQRGGTTVEGDRRNLVIFFTSNDSREFSEPFLRRVASIEMRPLPPAKVYELLKGEFGEKVAAVLAQVYADTLEAGLSKPATVQELRIAGKLLSQGMPFEDVVRAFIVKSAEDWERYVRHVKEREPYRFERWEKKEEGVNLVEMYEAAGAGEALQAAAEERGAGGASFPERVPPVRLSSLSVPVKEPAAVPEEGIDVYFVAEDRDDELYTEIVKLLRPAPGEDPARLGKFRQVVDSGKVYVVADEPLTLFEALALGVGEGYVEEELYVGEPLVRKLLRDAERVRYYGPSTLVLEWLEEGTQTDEEGNERVFKESVVVRLDFLEEASFSGVKAFRVRLSARGSLYMLSKAFEVYGRPFVEEERVHIGMEKDLAKVIFRSSLNAGGRLSVESELSDRVGLRAVASLLAYLRLVGANPVVEVSRAVWDRRGVSVVEREDGQFAVKLSLGQEEYELAKDVKTLDDLERVWRSIVRWR